MVIARIHLCPVCGDACNCGRPFDRCQCCEGDEDPDNFPEYNDSGCKMFGGDCDCVEGPGFACKKLEERIKSFET